MSRQQIDICKYSVSQWGKLIDEWIYSERDRQIIKRRMLDGICYEELAEEFDMSDRQIKRICQSGIARISTKI